MATPYVTVSLTHFECNALLRLIRKSSENYCVILEFVGDGHRVEACHRAAEQIDAALSAAPGGAEKGETR